jgi:hypothetical protein
MNRKLVFSAMLVLLLAFCFVVVSCNSGNSAFVGKWDTEDGLKAPSGLPDDLELFKDGTGVIEGMSISWKAENKRFIITSSSIGFAYDYEISGKKLTLTGDNGRSKTYLKR